MGLLLREVIILDRLCVRLNMYLVLMCFSAMWKGLFPRIIMIGTLTALQWFIYDGVKVYFRLPRPPPPEMPESLKKKLGEGYHPPPASSH